MTNTTIRKKYKSGHNMFEEKKKNELSVCLHMRFKYEVTISDRTRKIERGIALLMMPLVLITTVLVLMYSDRLWSYLLMSHELGSATDMDRLFVSSGLSKPIFTLIGNDGFWSCHSDFWPKMSSKIGNFECSWISRQRSCRIPKQFGLHIILLLCHCQCFQFSSPNLEWLTGFDFRKLHPFLYWPSSYSLRIFGSKFGIVLGILWEHTGRSARSRAGNVGKGGKIRSGGHD